MNSKQTVPGKLGAPWWAVTIPTLAAFLLLAFGFWLVMQNAMLRTELDDAKTNRTQQQAAQNQNQLVLDALTATDAKRFTLVPAQTRPQPQAQVVYQARSGGLVLLGTHLEPVPAGKTYQLWLLPAGTAEPLPAGTFRPDANGNATLLLPTISAGTSVKGFAVTVEDDGGSPQPTLPFRLMGLQ